MPNQNFHCNRDEVKVLEYAADTTYKTCKPLEKVCRFAYASWCPVCDTSNRRRCKSETLEPIHGYNGRDFKTPSPRRLDHKMYPENKDSLDLSNIRSDMNQFRSNLRELPTTYISNNCQSNVPCNSFGTNLQSNSDNGVTKQTYHRVNNRSPKYLNNSVKKDVLNVAHKTIVPVHSSEIRSVSPLENGKYLTKCVNGNVKSGSEEFRKNGKTSPLWNDNNCVSISHESSTSPVDFVPVGKSLAHIKRPIPCKLGCSVLVGNHQNACFENKNCFKQNNCNSTEEKSNLQLEHLRARIEELKNTHRSAKSKIVHTSDDVCFIKRSRVRQRSESDKCNTDKSCLEKDTSHDFENCNGLSKKAREVSPVGNILRAKMREALHVNHAERSVSVTEVQNLKDPEAFLLKKDVKPRPKSTGKVVSIRNRSKLNAVKLKPVKNRISNSVSGSDHSDSDYSDIEDLDRDSESECELLNEAILASSSASSNEQLQSSAATHLAAGDSSDWPLRYSLFPNIPPYLRFSLHDDEPIKLSPNKTRYLKWKLSSITPVIVRKTLVNSGFRLVRSELNKESNEWLGTWGKHMKSNQFKLLKETQKLNHFPGTFQVGRKDRLWRNLQRLAVKFGQKEFGFTPRTFVLPQDMKLLRQVWDSKNCSEKWIIKPPASARGTGIKVICRWAQLPKKKPLVVQQYISDPYLINGSKFDLRLYVLVTSFNPLRIYLYPDGLVRFASVKYSQNLQSLSDRYMHLTNYSINKLSSQYTSNENANACQGHKWTISKLWDYLAARGADTKALWKNLQQLVIKTMISAESSITQLYDSNVSSRYNCYELFGVDVLLDERLKAWLLEVNISPSLHSNSTLDSHIKGPIVRTLFDLAQFHLPPRLNKMSGNPPCFDARLYTTQLSKREQNKHIQFSQCTERDEYLTAILDNLTGDDVRHLTQAEDELTVIGDFERIFPTSKTHLYHRFMEPRYYNRLFDAWEHKYENNRVPGIKHLQSKCEQNIHLNVPSPTNTAKNLPNPNPVEIITINNGPEGDVPSTLEATEVV